MVRRYVEWLSGEYFKQASDRFGHDPEDEYRRTIELLKLHALFGSEILLNDSYLDSYVTLSLFADKEFRDFLERVPSFFQLSSKVSPIDQSSRYAIVTAGLHRYIRHGWLSSAFRKTPPVVDFAKRFLDQETITDIDIILELRNKKSPTRILIDKLPDQENLAIGMLYGLGHFLGKNTIVTPAPELSDPMNLYIILERVMNDTRLDIKQEKYLSLTKNFIDTHIKEPENRQYQSDILRQLEKSVSKKDPLYNTVRHTTTHAWNAAVDCSLASDGGSLGYLSDQSVQVGAFLARPVDTLAPLSIIKNDFATRSKEVIAVDWNTNLDWSKVGDIVQQTQITAKAFQNALFSDKKDDIIQATTKHVNALSQALIPTPKVDTFLPKPSYLLLNIAGAVCVILGAIDLIPKSAAIAAPLVNFAKQFDALVFKGCHQKKRTRMTDTLRNTADHLVLTPPHD